MADPRDVLAKDATLIQWATVFREEDGWLIEAQLSPITHSYELLGARRELAYCGPTEIFPAAITVNKDDILVRMDGSTLIRYVANLGASGCGPTLGDLLDIANELAATRFCGGWKQ